MIEKHYLLDFDPVVHHIEQGLANITIYQRSQISLQQYVAYLLEWLNDKIDFREPTTAADLGTIYLKTFGIDPDWAHVLSNKVLDSILTLIVGSFPEIDYYTLTSSRFIFDGFSTLNVYIKMKEEKEIDETDKEISG